ncbi:dTDP-4-dehydrorhamnose reductase [Bizionia paragorgiae]|uniref:dTDP-4-dehydrorhamnose reductase n=1 Tax=Bizionia paragorgiae TaxID=283786 RepID=A0A1H4BC57_BIZPA|nr:dTDP-4-dehydrorhamnose reductase [Bizionia paragorgiae]SEA45686.1 dTDP-4-dehydrorhamnose reductase [Bizionia paragorgiae]
MLHILVTGSKGQLGSEIKKISKDYPTIKFTFVDREEMPLDDNDSIIRFLNQLQPNLIVSAGAYTAVDQAENEKELVDQINHLAVATMAKWCADNHAKLIHISTDYVFDGKSDIPYKESDFTAPINWYGETKLRGEQAIERIMKEAVIIRTSWVYSEYGNNFVKTMLRLMKDRESIGVVNDQVGTPTYAYDLAEAIITIITGDTWEPGVYHYSNEGQISWFEFAVAIKELSQIKCEVKGVTSDEFPTLAKRPKYSLLDKTKIKTTYKLSVPDWKNSLDQCLQILNA